MKNDSNDGSVSYSVTIPDLTCKVCKLRISVHCGNGFMFTHAHGGCDEWRNHATRSRCIGRAQLDKGLRLRFWPKGESEWQGALGYGGNS